MDKSELKDFAGRYREAITRRLWDQWTAIGGGGYALSPKPVTWAVDLEALILASSNLFSCEPRLREVVLAWILSHGGLISIARIKRMQQGYAFGDAGAMADLAETLLVTNPSMRSWKSIATWAPRIAVKEAKPFQKAGITVRFQPDRDACLFLTLRSLLGVSSRVEILFWLNYNSRAQVSWMARETVWYGKTVQQALNEMVLSGHVREDNESTYRRYQIVPSEWSAFFPKRDFLEIWLGQHHLYAGVFGILKTLLRCAGDEMAEDAARFLIVEELRKGYDAHRRAREHLAGGSRSPGTLIGVIAQVVENIESSTDWPTGAFSTDPHRCQFD